MKERTATEMADAQALVQARAASREPTAYDRAQAELVRRIEALEAKPPCRCGSGAHPRDCELHPWGKWLHCLDLSYDGLADRIEALEAEVARLKAWSRPPENMCLQCGAGFVTADHKQTHKCQSSDDETVDVSVPAYEHFKACGPLCRHVQWCTECANLFALCPEHAANQAASCTWKEQP